MNMNACYVFYSEFGVVWLGMVELSEVNVLIGGERAFYSHFCFGVWMDFGVWNNPVLNYRFPALPGSLVSVIFV